METKFNKTTPVIRDSVVNWQKILAQGFHSAKALLEFLDLSAEENLAEVEQQFATRVPLGFAKRMQKGNPYDPLLLQVLASQKENQRSIEYIKDPLEERQSNPIPGLIHKYQSRVLLTLAGACAVNCRYCFRRHFAYSDNNPGREGWHDALDYIAQDHSIHEVILSGGDPLIVADKVFAELFTQIARIEHVDTIRIHTRIPIVLPERINDALLQTLKNTRLKTVIVLHCNHPQELDESVAKACQDLRDAGCQLLNQSVLLSGINDDLAILIKLSKRLFSFGILPYYLHLLDKVEGAIHFDSPLEKAQALHGGLKKILPGYLVPKLVKEEPGETGKTWL